MGSLCECPHLRDDEAVAKMGHPAFGLVWRLVRRHHGVVELLEEGVVFFFAVLFGEAEGLDAFDEDFGGVGLGFEDLDGLGEVVVEGHGARVGGLGAAHEFGLDVGRDEFDDFDVGGLELVAQGLGVGVDGGLGGVVGGGDGHGEEGEAGRDGHDGGVGLFEEVRQKRGGEADGAEEVGGDDGVGVGGVGGLEEVFGAHDAGVVDDDVEGGKPAVSFWAKERMPAASSMLRIAEDMPGLAATVSSRTCLRRPAMMTLLPSLWRASARPPPIPEPPPVMRMVLPVVFMMVLSPEVIVGWFVSVRKQAPEGWILT
jgi:hypothetical protein